MSATRTTTVRADPPQTHSLPALRSAVRNCQACELHRAATQAVFGDGPARSTLMLVGEQPGDQEDRQGEPFVGPAGRILDEALAAAGLNRERVYLTNAVKHFRFHAAGKRRIHDSPAARHVTACLPWLEAELGIVRPRVLVTLGATAGKAVLGSSFRLTQHQGELMPWPSTLEHPGHTAASAATGIVATLHPAAVLRAHTDRNQLLGSLIRDLRYASDLIAD